MLLRIRRGGHRVGKIWGRGESSRNNTISEGNRKGKKTKHGLSTIRPDHQPHLPRPQISDQPAPTPTTKRGRKKCPNTSGNNTGRERGKNEIKKETFDKEKPQRNSFL